MYNLVIENLFGEKENAVYLAQVEANFLDYPFNNITIDLSKTYNVRDVALSIINSTIKYFNIKVDAQIGRDKNSISILKSAFMFLIYHLRNSGKDIFLVFKDFHFIEKMTTRLLRKDFIELLEVFADVIKSDTSVKFLFVSRVVAIDSFFTNKDYPLYRLANKKKIIVDVAKIQNMINSKLTKELQIDTLKTKKLLDDVGVNKRYLYLFIEEYTKAKDYDRALDGMYVALKIELKREFTYLMGRKNLSDILLYVAENSNIYKEAKENNFIAKSNVKINLNELEKLGLIVQVSVGFYKVRDIFICKYVFQNFSKRIKND